MIASLSLLALLGVFVVAITVVVLASIKATGLADVIADRTNMGESLAGGLIVRQRAGPGRIGIESVLMILIYGTALGLELT